MAVGIRRRQFIGALGGAAVARPFTARAQQPAMPVVGFLRSTSLANATPLVIAFRQGLKEIGFVEGQNVVVEFHSAEGQPDGLRALAADLVRRPVALIAGNGIAALAAKIATTSVPIVFATGGDPVEQGLVVSLSRPGANVTGVSFLAGVLGAKRLELLRQLVPNATVIGMLVNPHTTETETERRDVQAAAQALRQQLIILDASSDGDIETAMATFVQRGAGAVVVGTGTFMFAHRAQLLAIAARHALPMIYSSREAVLDGGLVSYSGGQLDAYRQVGIYAGRILRGEKPADLPVMQSTKFELVINLKTAKALGITVPQIMQMTADEVIE